MENIDSFSAIRSGKFAEYWDSFLKPENNIGVSAEEEWKKKVEFLEHISMQNHVMVFLWNPYTNRFLYMSDKVKVLSGLEPAPYLAENGVEYSFSRIYPDHRDGIMQLSQAGAAYFTKQNSFSNKSIIASLNYKYKNGNNEYVQVLQRIQVLELDETNQQPTLFLSLIYYVGHIKRADSIGCVISTPEAVTIYGYNIEQKSIDPPRFFSEHEKKIINLLAQGHDTKTIAQMLFISPHTVDTHRRNLIKKMDCIDSTGVVAFAKLINLI